MGFFRKHYEKAKREVKSEFKHRSELRKAERKAYRESQKVEAHNYGVEKAKYERQQKIKRLKEKPKSFTFGGFAGPTQKNPSVNLGLSDYLLGSPPKKKNRRSGYDDDMGLF